MATRRPRIDKPQANMEEHLIEDQELFEAASSYCEHQESHAAFVNAKRTIKVKMKDRAEGLYRCGRFAFEVKAREGGGLSIPEWKANVTTVTEN